MSNMILKATISVPQNSAIEGYIGRIFLVNGKVIKVLEKQMCEPQEYGEAFTWDYFPFETKEACKAAVQKRVSEIRRQGR